MRRIIRNFTQHCRIQLAQDRDGFQQRLVIIRGAPFKRFQKTRRKLPEIAVARAQQIEIRIVKRA